jgi:formamidopyrimidine-DNA glycosylase
MFELPELVVLARQISQTLKGRKIQKGTLGNSPHKWVWYNRTHEEFERLVEGKTVGEAYARGRWLFIPLEPGYVLSLGECGGRVLQHPQGSKVPKKYHLYLSFEDGSFFTATTQMWGAMELYEQGEEKKRKYIRGMKMTPNEPEFTYDYFAALVDRCAQEKKRSAKGLLTQDQIIPGLGNSIAQDILFRARIHPRRSIGELSTGEKRALYDAIKGTVREITEKGGRYDEYDLHGNPGNYVRIMDKNAVGRPCPECGGKVAKIQYLGGRCYFCPTCQS